jgi:hypothetical protein
MERYYDCECHNYACNEIDGARLKSVKDVYGGVDKIEVLPTTINQCEIRKEFCKKAGELTIKLAAYESRFGLDKD